MRYRSTVVFSILTMSCTLPIASAAISLGTADRFVVLGASTVTNTGVSVLNGSAGVSPGLAMTGFPPAIVVGGTMNAGNAVAAQAQSDARVAYADLSTLPRTATLTGVDLGGLTLAPGVYFFESSAQLTGTLTLDAGGLLGADYVFQIGSTLTTASASAVIAINGADGCQVFWQVGSSATLGTDTVFEGNILAEASITLNTRVVIVDGRAIALTGAVTMDTNTIGTDCLPTPGAAVAFGAAFVFTAGSRRRSVLRLTAALA